MGEWAIYARNLTRTFGVVCAVDHIQLTVALGTTLALFGPPGAGKSTIIRLLLGLIEPTKGQATVLGYDTCRQRHEIRRHTGAIWRDEGLFRCLSVLENLEYYAHSWQISATNRRSRALELLSYLNLWEVRWLTPLDLTPLQRRQLALARALFHRPKLLFADEPSAGLPADDKHLLRRDLARLVAHEGVTLLLATPHLGEVHDLATTVARLDQGQLGAVMRVMDNTPLPELPCLEIVGRGFTDEVVALVQRRQEVIEIQRHDNRLLLCLALKANSAPIVSLLVESGAEVEEVHKHADRACLHADAWLV